MPVTLNRSNYGASDISYVRTLIPRVAPAFLDHVAIPTEPKGNTPLGTQELIQRCTEMTAWTFRLKKASIKHAIWFSALASIGR